MKKAGRMKIADFVRNYPILPYCRLETGAKRKREGKKIDDYCIEKKFAFIVKFFLRSCIFE